MKKRLLSMLMAMCLMATMVPAAFAAETDQPDTIIAPNGEEMPIPNTADYEAMYAEEAVAANDHLPDANGVYHIRSLSDFSDIPATAWYQGSTFELETDLNLAALSEKYVPAEWNGYIRFFKGTLNGNGHTIRGIANNRYLIYAMIGGQIDNLTIELDGQAGALIYAPGNDNKTPVETKLTRLTATGEVYLSSADQSNYSPFIYCSGKGGLTMDSCVNEAKIDGSIYGGIFYGYYPLFVKDDAGNPVKYVFNDCHNRANVTMKYAAMFFGNPTTIENKLTEGTLNLTITNCTNENEIRGTVSSHYFAPSLGGAELTGKMLEMENKIMAESTNDLSDELLTIGTPLEGFTYSVDPTTKEISVTAPTNVSNVSYYVVSVASYCSWYAPDSVECPEDERFGGTNRYAVTEKIYADELAANGVQLKYYGIADEGFGEDGEVIVCTDKGDKLAFYNTQVVNETGYYTLSPLKELINGKFQQYAHMENGKPVPGVSEPYFLDVVAFNADGKILGYAKEA